MAPGVVLADRDDALGAQAPRVGPADAGHRTGHRARIRPDGALLLRGEVWGVLAIAGATLNSADAAALGLFASQLASALEVSDTIANLERRNRELAAIQQIATACRELDALARELLRVYSESTSSDAAGLWLLDPEHNELVLAGEHGGFWPPARRHPRIPLAAPGGPGPPGRGRGGHARAGDRSAGAGGLAGAVTQAGALT